jgi:GNAT superfamily N-acetyltransferase
MAQTRPLVTGAKFVSEYPKNVDCKGTPITLNTFQPGDMEAMEIFAQTVPVHDLLFLGRDIQHPKVIRAWAMAILEGDIVSLIAWLGNKIVGTSAIVRDRLSWSPHVAELRLLVSEDVRGLGLGRCLLQHSFALAVDSGAEKLMARMTPDQKGAISMFEEMGFRGEAMLRDHVRDRNGEVHDLAIYSLNVGRIGASHGAYGFSDLY